MDDGPFMSGEFRYYFADSPPAPNSSMRENQYYDPVHESREWHLNNTRSPAYLTQIASTWATSPSLAIHQNPSDNGFQELYNPLHHPQEDDDSFTSAIPSSDGLINNSNNYNTAHFPPGIYDYELANEVEPSPDGRQNIEPSRLATTISEFMSPMFLSNPELASIDTQRTQMNSTTTERSTFMPSRPQLQSLLRRHIAPLGQTSTVANPSDVEPALLQAASRLRRRHRNQHNHPEVPNLQIPSSENILRREYGVAFGNSSSGGNSTASAIREAVIRRAIVDKRIPSKSVIATFEAVRLEELEKNDRSCIICYNEFGVINPEGIIELPLRLPKCKHIFGDKCIKKWFEDSDSCPYCRDKLPCETSLKKIYGLDTPSQSRDRLVALRRRIVHAQNMSRYISTVELTNSRIAQTMQLVFINLNIDTSNLTRSSNTLEPPRNDISRGPSSVLTSDDLQNLSVNRASATDSERRRCLHSRGISPRSANHISRSQIGRSSRASRSNPSASPDPGIFPQIVIPLGSNSSGLNTSIQDNTSPLHGRIGDQETNFQASSDNLQLNRHRRPSYSFPETIPWRGITSFSTTMTRHESNERMNEILEQLRNETQRTFERNHFQCPNIRNPNSEFDYRNEGFVRYSPPEQIIETEIPRPQLSSTPNRQPHDSRDVMSINSISQNIFGDHSGDHSGEDTNSEDLINSFSQSPPQPVA